MSNIGNLPIKAFSANVYEQQAWKVTVNFQAGIDITGATVDVYQRNVKNSLSPTVNITGQQLIVSYTSEQLKKLPSVTQHSIVLPNAQSIRRVAWDVNVATKLLDGQTEDAEFNVPLDENGEVVTVEVLGLDVISDLTEQAQTAATSAGEDAVQTAADRVATGQDRTATVAAKDTAVSAKDTAVTASNTSVAAAGTATTKAAEAAASAISANSSKVAAGISETNAANSAIDANNSKVAAGVSETNSAASAASALASKNAIPVSSQVHATNADAYAYTPTIPTGGTYLLQSTGDNLFELRERTGSSTSISRGFYYSSAAIDRLKTGSVNTHRAALSLYASVDNLCEVITVGSTINSSGDIVTGQASTNKIINRVPIKPGASFKLIPGSALTSVFVAEYDIDQKFISKATISSGVDVAVSAGTYYIHVGYVVTGTVTIQLTYTQTPALNSKITNAKYSDTAGISNNLLSSIVLRNVSLFASTYASANSAIVSIVNDGDGFLVTAIAATGSSCSFSNLATVSGAKYQAKIDYEVIEINATNATLNLWPLFNTPNTIAGRTLTSVDIGVVNSFTARFTANANGTTAAQLNLVATGAKINGALDYYAKVRIRDVSIIRVVDDLQYVPSIERQFGKFVADKYLSYTELDLYNKLKLPANYLGYNLVRIDDVELTKSRVAGRTIEINTTTSSLDISVARVVPANLLTKDVYAYCRAEFTVNSMDADYTRVRFRISGQDEYIEVSRSEIGQRKVVTLIRKISALSASADFVTLLRTETYTGYTASTSYAAGVTPTVNMTLHNLTLYASEKMLPVGYQTEFFNENHTEEILMGYVKEPVTEVIVNAFGDSITEQGYFKFIAMKPYNPKYNIYGLRQAVSTATGALTAGCIVYTAMTDNADVILTLFGTHDWGQNAAIGTIGTLNTGTFIGAYEVLIRGLMEKYPGKIILVVTPTPRNLGNNDNEWLYQKNANGDTLLDYGRALIELCRFYGNPYVDGYLESGVNVLNMTGHPNLYIAGTTTDNTILSATGVSSTDNTYFTSDYITINPAKIYITNANSYFCEYDSLNTFIRRTGGTKAKLYPHPDCAKVRLSVSKSTVVVDNTVIGVTKDRFWFADAADSWMTDRIHPNYKSQRQLSAAITKVLRPILDARKMNGLYQSTIFNNAD